MELTQEAPPVDKRPQARKVLAQQVKALTDLWSKRVGYFLLSNVLYGLAFSTYFGQFVRFSLQQEYAPHFYLILLVVLYLMYTRRQALLAHAEYCARGGLPLVLVGAVCSMMGWELRPSLSQQDFMALTTLGAVTVWVGGFVTFFGLPATRLALFPLSFLVFLIPLPAVLLSQVITALQYASAEVVSHLFKLTPLPVFQEGLFFTMPGLSIEVARECSSIRSSLALLIASALAAHLLLRRWWSKAVVLLLVFPLAVFKNGVRIVTLSLLTLYADTGFMHGGLHTRGGAVFFGLAVAILLPICLGLGKLESRQTGVAQVPQS